MKKNIPMIVLGGLLLSFFLLWAFTFQVAYNEVAVVTRFGKAVPEYSHINADPEQPQAGLKFMIPVVHDVHRFDKRVQVLESQLEEQQTADEQNIVLSVYLTWRIVDPLAFYRAFENVENATSQIRDRLRDAQTVLGTYKLTELTSTEPKAQKLSEAETKILEKLRADLTAQAAQGKPLGIEYQTVGIRRIVLSEKVADNVFERMRSTRQRKAQRARSEGHSAANDIKARAQSDKQRILAFAERRAQSIRAEGDAAAAQYYAVFNQDERFAIFLRKLEAYKEIFKNNTTFFLDAKEGLGQEFLKLNPAKP